MANEKITSAQLADNIMKSIEDAKSNLMELVKREDLSQETRDLISQLNDATTRSAHIALDLKETVK